MCSGGLRFVRLLLLLLLALTPALCNSLVSGDVNCTTVPSPPPNTCLPNLAREPALYERCKREICYLFLQEAPFITLNATHFSTPDRNLQVPFNCSTPSTLHPSLSGLAFHLHARTSSASLQCIWAGPISQCSFNRLVNFTAASARQGYQFAITGLLLETPSRQCHHIPSAPFIDNAMVIIGRTDPENPTVRSPLYQLLRPFRWSTWGIFAAITLLFFIVSLIIALRVRVARRRSLVTAFFIFAGERDQAVAHERELRRNSKRPASPPARTRSWRMRWRPNRRRRKPSRLTATTNTTVTTAPSLSFPSSETPRARRLLPLRLQHLQEKRQQEQMQEEEGKVMALATKYGLSMTLFRISLLAFLGVFALFYEVAVVNFVFQQSRVEIGKSVRNLSSRELAQYAVLRNSALENVWSAAVNPRGTPFQDVTPGDVPWARCDSGAECIQWVADEDNPVNFDVTFEILGTFLVKSLGFCKELTIFETRDILYQFNAGWLYNDVTDVAVRTRIDRELVALRINGTIRQLIEDEIGEAGSCSTSSRTDIGPLIILVPCSLVVLPPLFLSLLALFWWPDNSGGVPADARSDEEQGSVRESIENGESGSMLEEIDEDEHVEPVQEESEESREDEARASDNV